MVRPRYLKRWGIRLLIVCPFIYFGVIYFSMPGDPDSSEKLDEIKKRFVNKDQNVVENSNALKPKQAQPLEAQNINGNNAENVAMEMKEKRDIDEKNDNKEELPQEVVEEEKAGDKKEENVHQDDLDKWKDPQRGQEDGDREAKVVLAAPGDPDKPLVDPNAPGEMGKPVVIDIDKLSKEEKNKYDQGWADNAFNQYASDMISLHRSLPDVRDPECRTLKYSEDLPDACVIIIFHNEAWSVLLRTVYSVIDRSKPTLLKQVILVDDFSHFDHLKKPLDDFVAKEPKVSLVRSKERTGLIRARLMGFNQCTASVAIFLDSHCEATEGWLEPLLDPIAQDSQNVVVPNIDTLSDDTFTLSYQAAKLTQAGGFSWDLIFNWHSLPEEEMKRRDFKYHLPFRTPTMAGGLFAIDSEYFRTLGTYDSGMDIWGGENLELSFKTWMCGGTLLTIPCSHVGHVFRKRSPYKWDTKVNVLKRNTVRLAEVWLDDFKTYYYQRINNELGDYGDISERLAIRKRLNCKSFKWYLNNVYPELFIPGEALAGGEIRNFEKDMCIDASVDPKNVGKPVIAWPCHKQGGNQYWMLSKKNELRRDEICLDYSGGEELKTYGCHGFQGNQKFEYREDNTIYNPNHNKCVTLTWDSKGIKMEECNGSKRQQWKMNRDPPKGPTKD